LRAEVASSRRSNRSTRAGAKLCYVRQLGRRGRVCTSRSENKRRVGKRERDKTAGCDVEVGNARHTRGAGRAHELAFVRRNVALGGRRRRADSGNACSRAWSLGAHTHESARGANDVQSLTSDGRWSAREVFDQWLREREEELKSQEVSIRVSRLAEEPGEFWSSAAASLKPSVRVTMPVGGLGLAQDVAGGGSSRVVVAVVVVIVEVVLLLLRETRGHGARDERVVGGGRQAV